ncbi:DUF3310 domain-containing protein [Staphylococcus simulans]|uniref:DUF3310 domain-containing protein n=1 Tax=Staphylococcus simulans TaxID=1286 RepID=UPI001F5444E1|nr:DUF3310 domain-containing protein [Staphylococcus simulans]
MCRTGHAGVVIREVDRLGKQSVMVQLDGIDDPFELTDVDYFDKLPISFKKAEHFEDCKNNSVHQPNHYQFGQFTAAMIIELVGRTYKSAPVFYHVGNALKYLMRDLSNTIKQRFKSDTRGRSLTQLEQELQSRGVKGFVIDASPARITVLADRADYERNRRNWDEIQIHGKTSRRC